MADSVLSEEDGEGTPGSMSLTHTKSWVSPTSLYVQRGTMIIQ